MTPLAVRLPNLALNIIGFNYNFRLMLPRFVRRDSLAKRFDTMQLSLSVRIAEEFLSKEKASMPLDELAALAKRCGYGALCMRASQVGVHSSPEAVESAVEFWWIICQ